MRNATFKSIEGDTYMKLSAALRNSGSGWYVIDDGAHEPLGVTIGAVTSTQLEVLFPAAAQVCDLVVTPDETLARPPYSATFGASIGLNRALIEGTVSGVAFDPSAWSDRYANLVLSGWMLLG